MIVFYILLIVLCLFGLRPREAADTSYLSKEQGDAVKGIFIILVFLAHASQAAADAGTVFSGPANDIYWWIQGKMGQMCVVMFLFFSGYGVMNSIAAKGRDYVRSIPRHRALGTLVNFQVAVAVYALVQLLMGRTYSPLTYLLAFAGWESIGNSCWYIFVIILCYLSTWLSATLVLGGKKPEGSRIVAVNLILIVFIFIGLLLTREPYWYKTLAAYPLGMSACMLKSSIDGIGRKAWWIAFILALACYIATYPKHNDPYQLVYTVRTISFAILAVLLLRKFRIGNPVLVWFGRNLFPLYIYQRLAMMLVPAGNPYLFVSVSFALTCLMAYLYRFIRIRI